jgi:hypothetical protein
MMFYYDVECMYVVVSLEDTGTSCTGRLGLGRTTHRRVAVRTTKETPFGGNP